MNSPAPPWFGGRAAIVCSRLHRDNRWFAGGGLIFISKPPAYSGRVSLGGSLERGVFRGMLLAGGRPGYSEPYSEKFLFL